MSAAWKDPNVHSWTRRMQAQLSQEVPELPALTTAVTPAQIDDTFHQIEQYIRDASALAALQKMLRRRTVRDSDLLGVSNAGFLVVLWDLALHSAKESPEEAARLLEPTLADMGTTCVQGDSHRMFSLYVALRRSNQP